LDISEFAIIKAEQKYVIGVLPGGVEWFLPHKTSVEGVELAARGCLRFCVNGISVKPTTGDLRTGY
jgi:hypothetical protein